MSPLLRYPDQLETIFPSVLPENVSLSDAAIDDTFVVGVVVLREIPVCSVEGETSEYVTEYLPGTNIVKLSPRVALCVASTNDPFLLVKFDHVLILVFVDP